VVERSSAFIVVDDESRMGFQPGDRIGARSLRFRTLGCWPVTGAIESDTDLKAAVEETLGASSSERQGLGRATAGPGSPKRGVRTIRACDWLQSEPDSTLHSKCGKCFLTVHRKKYSRYADHRQGTGHHPSIRS
jgi:hypothetical protein